MICYVPLFENIFNTVPLTINDWYYCLIIIGFLYWQYLLQLYWLMKY